MDTDVVANEESEDCAALADAANLSPDGADDDIELDELLRLSDEALAAFEDGDSIGTLGLESFLAPGGNWNGSETPARRGIRIGHVHNGLILTSAKRATGNSGSDHHVSQKSAFAGDVSNGTRPTPQMLRTARQIAAAMGYPWPANGYLQTAITSRGYRAQLIYNSTVVPNHHNHVHFGVRKVR